MPFEETGPWQIPTEGLDSLNALAHCHLRDTTCDNYIVLLLQRDSPDGCT